MNKNYLTIANALKKLANGLSEEDQNELEQIAAAVTALAGRADDEGKAEIAARVEQLKADLEKVEANVAENVAERIQKLRNELTGSLTKKDVKEAFTPAVRKAIANAILDSRYGLQNTLEAIEAVCKENGIEVRKKNSVTGLTFAEVIDYALQLKQENNDEIFDALYKTNRSKFFYGELDPTNASNIAKQWSKNSETSCVYPSILNSIKF